MLFEASSLLLTGSLHITCEHRTAVARRKSVSLGIEGAVTGGNEGAEVLPVHDRRAASGTLHYPNVSL